MLLRPSNYVFLTHDIKRNTWLRTLIKSQKKNVVTDMNVKKIRGYGHDKNHKKKSVVTDIIKKNVVTDQKKSQKNKIRGYGNHN